MFQNQHLSSIVNQLGRQQQQQKHQLGGKLGDRAVTTSPPLSLGIAGHSSCNQYELPRQPDPHDQSPTATIQTGQQCLIEHQQYPQHYRTQQLQQQPSPSFCAIGNRLNMATYARKENSAESELQQMQKQVRGRQKKGKSTLEKLNVQQIKGLKSLNSDLFAVGNKPRALTVTDGSYTTPLSKTFNYKGGRKQVKIGAPQTAKSSGAPPNPVQHIKELQWHNDTLTKDNLNTMVAIDSTSQRRSSQKDFITMNIELKTKDCRFTHIRTNSRLSETANGLNVRVSQVGGHKSTGYHTSEAEPVQMQIMLSQSPSQKKCGAIGTQLTIKKSMHDVTQTKELISDFDRSRSSMRSARSRENFATSSVVTQPNNLTMPEDLQRANTLSIPPSNPCSVPVTKESDTQSKFIEPQLPPDGKMSNHGFKLTQMGADTKLNQNDQCSELMRPNRSSCGSKSSEKNQIMVHSEQISPAMTPPKLMSETKQINLAI